MCVLPGKIQRTENQKSEIHFDEIHALWNHIKSNKLIYIYKERERDVPVAGNPTIIMTNLSLVVVPMTSSGAAFSPSGNRWGVGLLIVLVLLLLWLLAVLVLLILDKVGLMSCVDC